MIEASSDLLVFVDPTYVYLEVNQAYCDEHLLTREELLDHTVAEVFGEKFFEEKLKPHLDRCLTGERVTFEFWWDSPRRGHRHIDATYDPFIEADGSVSGVLVNGRDSTKRANAEGELHEGHRLNIELQRSLDDAPLGLCYIDADLRFVHINEWLAKINGLSVEAHLGKTLRELLPHLADGVEPQFQQVIDSGEPIIAGTVEAETPAHPGSKHTYEHYYYPDVGADGAVVGVSCVVLDITERKRDEEERNLSTVVRHTG